MRRYHLSDIVISAAIARSPTNTSIEEVLTKVVLINSLYGTAIYDTLKIADHICRIDFDRKVQNSDLSIIGDIRAGHKILTKKNNQRDLYSFATKYVSWHAPQSYPIYDSLVKKLLIDLNQRFGFLPPFKEKALVDYQLFKSAIDSVISISHLENLRYKKIDQALWIYAKYCYKQNELPVEVVNKIQRVIDAG